MPPAYSCKKIKYQLEDPDSAGLLINASAILLEAFVRPFSFTILISLLVMIILLFFSAMISGSETAFFSLNPQQRNQLRESGSGVDHPVLKLLERPKRLLATILIGNNFVNVAIVILSTYIVSLWFNLAEFPLLAFLLQVIVVTALILLFGEILPKMYASIYPVQFAKNMARTLPFLVRLFYPFSTMLVRSTTFLDRKLASKGQAISRSELSDAIEITAGETTPEDGKKILKGIVRFGDLEVKEIMRSRMDVVTLDIQDNFSIVMEIIIESGFSRIPVYSESFDNIKGVLYVKDLLPHIDSVTQFQWQEIIRDAFFVPENKKINDLLQEFQEKKIHLAIVVDEYGGTSGIITLEDILEEIVGEIMDESDIGLGEFMYERIDNRTFIFEGKTSINDFCKIIEVDDELFEDVKGESDTLAGLILELEGKIPKKDNVTNFLNFVFKVVEADQKRIKRVEVSIKDLQHE